MAAGPYYDACMYDIAATGDLSVGQASIVAYVSICEELGDQTITISTHIPTVVQVILMKYNSVTYHCWRIFR